MSFDRQPHLTGDVVSVEPLLPEHFDVLAEAAGDPGIWAGHPARDRHRPEVFRPYFDFLIAAGGSVLVREKDGGRVIGCSRYYCAPDRPDGIAIGFTFLTRDHWGGRTNRDLKRLMVGHALDHFGSVWFHIDPANRRSQVATMRLGAVHVYDAELALGPTPAPWKCYELTAMAWHAGDTAEKARQ